MGVLSSLHKIMRMLFDTTIVCILIVWYLISGFMFGSTNSNHFLTSLLERNSKKSESPNEKSNHRMSLNVWDYVVKSMSPFKGLERIRAKKSQTQRAHHHQRFEEEDHDTISDFGVQSQFTSPISSNVTSPDLTPMQTPMPSYTPFEENEFRLESSHDDDEILEEKNENFKFSNVQPRLENVNNKSKKKPLYEQQHKLSAHTIDAVETPFEAIVGTNSLPASSSGKRRSRSRRNKKKNDQVQNQGTKKSVKK